MPTPDELTDKVLTYIFRTILKGVVFVFVEVFRLILMLIGLGVRRAKQKDVDLSSLPQRFEHTHVVGGSGHGKTQLLQQMFLIDLEEFKCGYNSIIVIDSQGDMIGKILHLADLRDLSDRLILIDPSDIDYPPALNLFDFGLNRLNKLNPVDREKLINGAISLYEYLFGALLGAELTQRQGVIFRFLARLMLIVPNATIHTLMDFMQDPEAVRPYLSKLDPISKRFFETQFFDKSFDDTRQQILTRLWGVLSNPILSRMFSAKRNKIDMFEAMNKGSIILIYTAKDLLKQKGCEILGRFFIALIAQATLERATIPEDARRKTFVYIDEAHDYFDESLENLLNQARKYRVGLILAHQNLDQLDQKLRATVMASTSIKLVGGLSAKDAAAFAKEFNCKAEEILEVKKEKKESYFSAYIRNDKLPLFVMPIPLGLMENQKRSTQEEYQKIRDKIRMKYCEINQESASIVEPMEAEAEGVSQHEMV